MGARRDVAGFERAGRSAAEALCDARSVSVVAHIDADGITAGSIASAALGRAGVEHTVRFAKKIDGAEAERINADAAEIVWLVDMGSGAFSKLDHSKVAVSDHHRPDDMPAKTDLFSFGTLHVNPHLYGLDGSTEISGAGTAYVVAKAMGQENGDLAALAVVGALGDLQDSAEGRLIGYNRTILQDAIDAQRVRARTDLRLFGRETRPLPAFIQFSSDPALMPLLRATQVSSFRPAGEAGEEDGALCSDFLEELGVPAADGKKWRSWNCLSDEERRRIASELSSRLLDQGKGITAIRWLIGEVYELDARLVDAPEGWLAEECGSLAGDDGSWHPNPRALLDGKEMATLLNACGRHDRADLGLAICLGDRGEKLALALAEQDHHRASLREAIQLVQEGGSCGVVEDEELPRLRHFHGGDRIEDTIVASWRGCC